MRVLSLVPERHRGLAVVLATFATALACTGEAPEPMPSIAYETAAQGKQAGFSADAVGELALSRNTAAPPAPAAPPSQRPGTDVVAPTSMIIRTGNVSVRVDSLEPAMDALRALAARLGGAVGNVSVSSGDFAVRSATIELRVPSERFDEAMAGMKPIGRIETSTVGAQDVGEEYVDVTARITNAKRLEARLIDLLATRTGKLEDVLAVERELARVREEIERAEGRRRWLGARVETSTIVVTVSEPAPIVGENPGQSVIGQAFVRAWQNFVGLTANLIASLGVLLPLALAAWVVVRWWQRRRRGASMDA